MKTFHYWCDHCCGIISGEMGSISSQTDVSRYLFLEWRGNVFKAVREFLNYKSDPLELVYSGVAEKKCHQKVSARNTLSPDYLKA